MIKRTTSVAMAALASVFYAVSQVTEKIGSALITDSARVNTDEGSGAPIQPDTTEEPKTAVIH